jgi:hypothetical protein
MTPDPTSAERDAAARLSRRTIVRPYMLTRGRTSSSGTVIELHAPMLALVTPEELGRDATPEARRIIGLCRTPTSVAEVAARLGAPVGVARVLAGDLVAAGHLRVAPVGEAADHRDTHMLERLLEGIRAL